MNLNWGVFMVKLGLDAGVCNSLKRVMAFEVINLKFYQVLPSNSM